MSEKKYQRLLKKTRHAFYCCTTRLTTSHQAKSTLLESCMQMRNEKEKNCFKIKGPVHFVKAKKT